MNWLRLRTRLQRWFRKPGRREWVSVYAASALVLFLSVAPLDWVQRFAAVMLAILAMVALIAWRLMTSIWGTLGHIRGTSLDILSCVEQLTEVVSRMEVGLKNGAYVEDLAGKRVSDELIEIADVLNRMSEELPTQWDFINPLAEISNSLARLNETLSKPEETE